MTDGQTDRQTDGRTDGFAIAYSALSMLSRAKNYCKEWKSSKAGVNAISPTYVGRVGQNVPGGEPHMVMVKQEAHLLLGDRATRKHAKDCRNGRRNDNLG